MAEPTPLTDEILLFYMSVDGFTLEQAAKAFRVPLLKVQRQWDRIQRVKRREEAIQQVALQRATSGRPFPPESLTDAKTGHETFAPAHDLADWAKGTFIDRDATLCNPKHNHLQTARIGFLWTSVYNERQTKPVAGMACIPKAQGNRWDKARHDWLLEYWYGRVPHFLITLSAGYAAAASNGTFCALVEHELLHCAQAMQYGEPRFNHDDEPIYIMKGHDAEEFESVVDRYGVGHAAGGVAGLVEAASRRPSIAAADITAVCGTGRK